MDDGKNGGGMSEDEHLAKFANALLSFSTYYFMYMNYMTGTNCVSGFDFRSDLIARFYTNISKASVLFSFLGTIIVLSIIFIFTFSGTDSNTSNIVYQITSLVTVGAHVVLCLMVFCFYIFTRGSQYLPHYYWTCSLGGLPKGINLILASQINPAHITIANLCCDGAVFFVSMLAISLRIIMKRYGIDVTYKLMLCIITVNTLLAIFCCSLWFVYIIKRLIPLINKESTISCTGGSNVGDTENQNGSNALDFSKFRDAYRNAMAPIFLAYMTYFCVPLIFPELMPYYMCPRYADNLSPISYVFTFFSNVTYNLISGNLEVLGDKSYKNWNANPASHCWLATGIIQVLTTTYTIFIIHNPKSRISYDYANSPIRMGVQMIIIFSTYAFIFNSGLGDIEDTAKGASIKSDMKQDEDQGNHGSSSSSSSSSDSVSGVCGCKVDCKYCGGNKCSHCCNHDNCDFCSDVVNSYGKVGGCDCLNPIEDCLGTNKAVENKTGPAASECSTAANPMVNAVVSTTYVVIDLVYFVTSYIGKAYYLLFYSALNRRMHGFRWPTHGKQGYDSFCWWVQNIFYGFVRELKTPFVADPFKDITHPSQSKLTSKLMKTIANV